MVKLEVLKSISRWQDFHHGHCCFHYRQRHESRHHSSSYQVDFRRGETEVEKSRVHNQSIFPIDLQRADNRFAFRLFHKISQVYEF